MKFEDFSIIESSARHYVAARSSTISDLYLFTDNITESWGKRVTTIGYFESNKLAKFHSREEAKTAIHKFLERYMTHEIKENLSGFYITKGMKYLHSAGWFSSISYYPSQESAQKALNEQLEKEKLRFKDLKVGEKFTILDGETIYLKIEPVIVGPSTYRVVDNNRMGYTLGDTQEVKKVENAN